MIIKFLGGAGTVTGSKTLIESKGVRILIDCGLFQGLKKLRELNWYPFPVLPSSINYVLLTHGHLDHCGWLPRLVSMGFKGKIYCTEPTKEVTKLILTDSAKIQEDEALKANREHYSKHNPAQPLYTVAQSQKVFPLFRVIKPNETITLDPEISANFFHAGHIIGACSISLTAENKTLVFSGDIGRDNDVLMFPPVKPKKADYIFLESTYGNRLHPKTDVKLELETYIQNAVAKNGTVILPGFAVERAQSIMFLLWQLKKEGRLPEVPYIMDSPMGSAVLDVFKTNTRLHKLSSYDCAEICKMFTVIDEYDNTLKIIEDYRPKVIIAASGMATGGRVLSYFQYYIGLPNTTIVITGYQAEGTRGRKLLNGTREIKIYGHYYPVRATILQIEGLSAHADQQDLLNWLSALESAPKRIFLLHGEDRSADELRIRINERYKCPCSVPFMGEELEI